MLPHPQPPEYSWLPDLCVQKLSLPGTPCLRLSDYRTPDTSVASMRAQAPQDCKVDMTTEILTVQNLVQSYTCIHWSPLDKKIPQVTMGHELQHNHCL